MNTSQPTFPSPGSGLAVPTLPQSIASKNLLEHPLAADPGQIEYESWLPPKVALPPLRQLGGSQP
jgi:hypothetical protein